MRLPEWYRPRCERRRLAAGRMVDGIRHDPHGQYRRGEAAHPRRGGAPPPGAHPPVNHRSTHAGGDARAAWRVHPACNATGVPVGDGLGRLRPRGDAGCLAGCAGFPSLRPRGLGARGARPPANHGLPAICRCQGTRGRRGGLTRRSTSPGCNGWRVAVGDGYDGLRAPSAVERSRQFGYGNSSRVTAGARGVPPNRPRAPQRCAGVKGRAGGLAGSLAAAVALDDGRDILGRDAVEVDVQLATRRRERGPLRLGEQLSGPRHRGERGPGAGRACQCAAPPPGGQGPAGPRCRWPLLLPGPLTQGQEERGQDQGDAGHGDGNAEELEAGEHDEPLGAEGNTVVRAGHNGLARAEQQPSADHAGG
jgi:hypothetical protein